MTNMSERILCRNTSRSRIDIISHIQGVQPKSLVVGGRLELGPEHFEGYHYKGLIKSGMIREVKRYEVQLKVEKPLTESPPQAKSKRRRAFENRGQDSRKVESEKSSLNLSGEPASDQKDGV